eukprot:scaffold5791_cov181-Chaetoceros_neogracile.AAC.1
MTLHVHGCCKIHVDCWVHYGSYDTCSVCLDESFLGEWRVVGGRYVGGKRKAPNAPTTYLLYVIINN